MIVGGLYDRADLGCQISTLCVTTARVYRVNSFKLYVYLVFLYCTLLATNGTVPEAEEPGGGGGAGEGEGGALPCDRPQPRQPRHHLHPSRLHHHQQEEETRMED